MKQMKNISILLSLKSVSELELLFDESMFPTFHSCRYDIQIWDGAVGLNTFPEVKKLDSTIMIVNLETLNTIKRMNDISDRRIAEAANTGMYEARRGNLKTEISSHLDVDERKYVARNKLWEITVPPYEKPVVSNNLPYNPENLQIDLFQLFGSSEKFRIRIRDSSNENYYMEIISNSAEKKPITIHNSLLPQINNDKIDISSWTDVGWQRLTLKKAI